MGGVPVPEKHDSAIVFLFGVVSENIQLVFRGIHQQKLEFSQQKTLMILTYNFATIGLVLADLLNSIKIRAYRVRAYCCDGTYHFCCSTATLLNPALHYGCFSGTSSYASVNHKQ